MSICRQERCLHLEGIENAMKHSSIFVALLFWNNWCRGCSKIRNIEDYDVAVKELIDIEELSVL